MWPIVSRNFESAKPHGTICKSPEGGLTIIVELIGSFLWDLGGRQKENLSKTRCFQDDKTFWPIYRRIIDCDKPHKTFYNGPQAVLIIAVELIGVFF